MAAMTPNINTDTLPLVGISSCLMGQRVRYDGLDKFNRIVAEKIAPYCRLLPFCPEAVAGMGIPRPPINLISTETGIRAVGRDSPHADVTVRLHTVADAFASSYPELRGYILQSRSPSCGFHTTPVYAPDQRDIIDPSGSGLFAARIHARFPGLPLLNDTDLSDHAITQFLEQIQAGTARNFPG